MVSSLEKAEKLYRIEKHLRKNLPFCEKIVKIGPVDTEIALLIVKKNFFKVIVESKIYSPVGRFAERAK